MRRNERCSLRSSISVWDLSHGRRLQEASLQGRLMRRRNAEIQTGKLFEKGCKRNSEGSPYFAFSVLKGYSSDANKATVARVEELARKKGVSMAQIALAWVMNRDGTLHHYFEMLSPLLEVNLPYPRCHGSNCWNDQPKESGRFDR